jgi:hypothetical protein
MLSVKPVKFPKGDTRPVALGEKSPAGTAEPPWEMMGTLSVFDLSV